MSITSGKLLAAISLIRTEAAKFLIDTCTLRRLIEEQIIDGEAIPIYQDTAVACRWNPRFGYEQDPSRKSGETTRQTVAVGVYRLQLPIDTAINERDRVIYQDRTYDVVYVPPIHTFTGAFIIEVRERQ